MQPVIRYLRRNEDRFLGELMDYLRFPSVSAQSKHEPDMRACARWLVQHCTELGLQAKLCPTSTQPVVVASTSARPGGKGNRPHFLIYGHYDVQPAEPFELWKTPPFEPQRVGKRLFARGASDNKGQHFAHLKAVEAYLKTGTALPCDLTFVIEGEEEIGSHGLGEFLSRQRQALKCDAVVISDTGIPDLKHPALTYALRGVVALEVCIQGPARDLHSGIYGGAVDNPAMVLCQILGQLRDEAGRVSVPGFYDEVLPLTAYERRQLKRVPHEAAAERRFLGVPAHFGEKGFSDWERRSARPTLEINGLTSGYQGEGSKTIIPSTASAKLTMRLVPNQDPKRVLRLVMREIKRLCPRSVRLEMEPGHGAEPYLVSPTGPLAGAALRALKTAFGAEPILMREGGSIPIVSEFKKVLGAESLLMGLALPDANAHSPNESFHLDAFRKGMLMSAHLWQELAKE